MSDTTPLTRNGLLSVKTALGEVQVRVDATSAVALAQRRWIALGGRVMSVGAEDDFATTVDLAECIAQQAGATASADSPGDYRLEALELPRLHLVDGVLTLSSGPLEGTQ